MRRLISYMFTSLDGFIADRDGGLDWVPIDDELMRFANTGTIVIADDVPAAVGELKDRPGGDLLLICGPELRSTLAEHGLIDRHRTLVAPVVLGDGVPLFRAMREPLRLRLVDSSAFEGGVVMLDHANQAGRR